MSKPAAQGLGPYNLPERHGVRGRETLLCGRAEQGVLGFTWVLADAVLSVWLVTSLSYVGGFGTTSLTIVSSLQDRIINLVVGGLTSLLLVVSINIPSCVSCLP